MRSAGPCLVLLLVAGCGEGGRPACEVGDGGAIDSSPGDTDEETALLEGAHLSATCYGPNVGASAELDFEGARRAWLGGEPPSTIQVDAVGSIEAMMETPSPVPESYGLSGTRVRCVANFVENPTGARFLALRCFYPPGMSQSSTMELTIDVTTAGDGLAITGTVVGAATCDATDSASGGSYSFTLSGTPSFVLANETAQFP